MGATAPERQGHFTTDGVGWRQFSLRLDHDRAVTCVQRACRGSWGQTPRPALDESLSFTHTLAVAEESGDVERLTASLVRQTGVRLDTLEQHYQRWWPRDREAVRATHAMLDPAVSGPNCHRGAKKPVYTANRKWTMSPSWTT